MEAEKHENEILEMRSTLQEERQSVSESMESARAALDKMEEVSVCHDRGYSSRSLNDLYRVRVQELMRERAQRGEERADVTTRTMEIHTELEEAKAQARVRSKQYDKVQLELENAQENIKRLEIALKASHEDHAYTVERLKQSHTSEIRRAVSEEAALAVVRGRSEAVAEAKVC